MKRYVQGVAADANQFPILVRGADGDSVLIRDRAGLCSLEASG